MMIGGSNNSLFGFLAQSWKTNDTSSTAVTKPTFAASATRSSIKDEYIPSASSLLGASNKIGTSSTGAKPTVAELEKVLVGFLKKNSTDSYNEMVLEIDGSGKFVATDHTVFNINGNGEADETLKQKYLDKLNSIKVGDQTLGEAFLQAYGEEFGIDLNAARAEGREVKSLLFNFSHSVVGDQFVSQSTARTLQVGDSFYGIDDNTQEKIRASESLGNAILGKGQPDSLGNAQKSNASLSESKAEKSISFVPTSFMTNMFGTQQASSPMSGGAQDLNKMLLQGTITRVLEAHNVDLKEGDTISLSLNGNGEFSINADSSSIWGAKGEEIEGLCATLEKALNEAQTEDGQSLGKALLEQFSADMGFDLGEARTDENFSVSFSFKYNAETEKNEICDAQLRSLANTNKASKNDNMFMPDTRDLDVAIKQVLKDNGVEMQSGDSVAFDFGKDGLFSFSRQSSSIAGLDEKALTEIGKILDEKLNTTDFRNFQTFLT